MMMTRTRLRRARMPLLLGLCLLSSWGCSVTSRRPAHPLAYVSNTLHGTVSVVDPAAGEVIADVPVPRVGARLPFPGFLAATPDGAKVYVANLNSESLSVIDTARNETVRRIDLYQAPQWLAATPDGRRLYVANDGDAALVVDTSADVVAARIPLGGASVGAAVSPDGREAWLTTSGGLVVVDVAGDRVVETVAEVDAVSPVVFAPAGDTAFVLRNVHPRGSVLVIDTASRRVTATIPVDSSPVAAAVTPDGRWLYVVNRGSNNVSVVDLGSRTVAARLAVGKVPAGIAVAPDGSAVYVTDSVSNTISVISPAAQSVVGTIALHPPPQARPTGIVVVGR